jgi:hypothetical protein
MSNICGTGLQRHRRYFTDGRRCRIRETLLASNIRMTQMTCKIVGCPPTHKCSALCIVISTSLKGQLEAALCNQRRVRKEVKLKFTQCCTIGEFRSRNSKAIVVHEDKLILLPRHKNIWHS